MRTGSAARTAAKQKQSRNGRENTFQYNLIVSGVLRFATWSGPFLWGLAVLNGQAILPPGTAGLPAPVTQQADEPAAGFRRVETIRTKEATTERPPEPAPASPTTAAPATPSEPGVRPPGLYGTLETTMGVITFQLYEEQAPQSVRAFVELAQGRKPWLEEKTRRMVRRPLYPGLLFHRVLPNFMIQTGDPTGTGAGDVGFTLPDEFHPSLIFDRPGRFGMANVGRPNTNSSQFFITEVPTPWLDNKHTVFGQVIDGQDVVNAIARVPRGPDDKPATPVKIVRIAFDRVGPKPPNAPESAIPPASKKGVAPARTRPVVPASAAAPPKPVVSESKAPAKELAPAPKATPKK